MKIGTDGVLAGAWANAESARSILDVGTGCGLIALMMAQRFPEASVDAIDTDTAALADAAENIANSPFNDRIKPFQGDFLAYDFRKKYDFIVSNPPFHPQDTLSPDISRATARNAASLPVEPFARKISLLLEEKGGAVVIYPYDYAGHVIRSFGDNGLFLHRRLDIKGAPHRPFKRSLLHFIAETGQFSHDELCICNADGSRSEAYKTLTGDFHPF